MRLTVRRGGRSVIAALLEIRLEDRFVRRTPARHCWPRDGDLLTAPAQIPARAPNGPRFHLES
jgi:hypothetical protein